MSSGESMTAPASIAVRSQVWVAGEHTRLVGQTPSGQGAPGAGCGE
jgi:hypothetical protein